MVSSGFIPILGPTHSQTFAEAPQWYPLHTPPRQPMPLHVQGTASPGDGHHGMHDEPSWSVSWTHSPLHRNARGSGQAYSCDIQPVAPARGRTGPCQAITLLAPRRPTQDTGLRTQDSELRTKDRTGQDRTGQDRTGQDRTGRRLTHRHTDSGPATEQEQHIQPGSPPKQGKRQYRINSHAPDTVAARSGPQYPLSRSACPRSDRRMPLPARSRRAGTPAGLTPFPFTPCHETRHPQGRFP